MIQERLAAIQRELKAPKPSKDRPHTRIACNSCGKPMWIRDDYVHRHQGICMSCLKTGNKNALQHGDYKERLYKIWVGLKHRRGYVFTPPVCDEWKHYEVFKKWALENGYDDTLTIDRIENSDGYSPNNCQWIPLAENSGKDKQILHEMDQRILYQARKMEGITQREMASRLGVSRNTIQRAEKVAKGGVK